MQYHGFQSDENDDQTLVALMNKHPDYVTEEVIEESKGSEGGVIDEAVRFDENQAVNMFMKQLDEMEEQKKRGK